MAVVATCLLVLFLFVGTGFLHGAYATSSLPPVSTKSGINTGLKVICSPNAQGGYIPTGLFSVQSNAVYAVDYNTGDLLWCYQGNTYLVATPPSGGDVSGYYGFAEAPSSLGAVFAFITNDGYLGNAGLWFCIGGSFDGCSIKSTFITLPSSFCATQPIGICAPAALAMDKHLNIYYTDPSNQDVVSCSYASNYQLCEEMYNFTSFTGALPFGIFLDSKGNLWVSDESCSGYVWENGALQYSLGDAVSAITQSSSNPAKTQHLYLGITGECGLYPNGDIFDVNDDHFLPTPFTGSTFIYSITTRLQFTDGNIIYSVKDTT